MREQDAGFSIVYALLIAYDSLFLWFIYVWLTVFVILSSLYSGIFSCANCGLLWLFLWKIDFPHPHQTQTQTQTQASSLCQHNRLSMTNVCMLLLNIFVSVYTYFSDIPWHVNVKFPGPWPWPWLWSWPWPWAVTVTVTCTVGHQTNCPLEFLISIWHANIQCNYRLWASSSAALQNA